MKTKDLSPHGVFFVENSFLVFFGYKHTHLEILEDVFSKPTSLLKQVHGNESLPCTNPSSDTFEADAQWIKSNEILPLIKTADCLPVMITDSSTGTALSIHAGWRGVKNEIVTKSLEKAPIYDVSNLKIYIGPHIQKESFEVDRDVADTLLFNYNRDDNLVEKKGEKFYINLAEILIRQLISVGVKRSQILVSKIDTKTNLNFYSHRRGDPGRNYSFCLPL